MSERCSVRTTVSGTFKDVQAAEDASMALALAAGESTSAVLIGKPDGTFVLTAELQCGHYPFNPEHRCLFQELRAAGIKLPEDSTGCQLAEKKVGKPVNSL